MPSLTYFTAMLRYNSVSIDTDADTDAEPTFFGISASVYVTPFVKNTPPPEDDVSAFDICAATLTPSPSMLVLATLKARLDNGHLAIRADPDRPVYNYANQAAFPSPGSIIRLYKATDTQKVFEWLPGTSTYSEVPNFAPLRLTAQTAVLALPTGAVLGYTLDFKDVAYPSSTKHEADLPSFSFAAPSTDVVLDLATCPRITRR